MVTVNIWNNYSSNFGGGTAPDPGNGANYFTYVGGPSGSSNIPIQADGNSVTPGNTFTFNGNTSAPNTFVTFPISGEYEFEYTAFNSSLTCEDSEPYFVCINELDVYVSNVTTEQCDFTLYSAHPDNATLDEAVIGPIPFNDSTGNPKLRFKTIVEQDCWDGTLTSYDEGNYEIDNPVLLTANLFSGWSNSPTTPNPYNLTDDVIDVVLNTTGAGEVRIHVALWEALFSNPPPNTYTGVYNAVIAAAATGGVYTSTGATYSMGANSAGGAYYMETQSGGDELWFGIWNNPSPPWLGFRDNGVSLGGLDLDTNGDGVADTFVEAKHHFSYGWFLGAQTYPNPPYSPPSGFYGCGTLKSMFGKDSVRVGWGETICNMSLRDHSEIPQATVDVVTQLSTNPSALGKDEITLIEVSGNINTAMTCDIDVTEINADNVSSCCNNSSTITWKKDNTAISQTGSPIEVTEPGTYEAEETATCTAGSETITSTCIGSETI